MNPPADLLEFLRAGRRLEYDVSGSEIGPIVLKTERQLALSTITTFPGCQSIVDDPYEGLDALYQIHAFDLVAASEWYDVEGLLCWLVALNCYATVDPEHGDVITHPHTSWSDIAAEPRKYLDAQWSSDEFGERVLPWLHFPLKLQDADVVIEPYGAQCPVHQVPLTFRPIPERLLFDILRRRELEDWLHNYVTAFPRSGVPIDDEKVVSCEACRAAEDEWLNQVERSIGALDARQNAHGWVQCPGCGMRFMVTDHNAFLDGLHTRCGQRINILD